jgi:hypothetical protein
MERERLINICLQWKFYTRVKAEKQKQKHCYVLCKMNSDK